MHLKGLRYDDIVLYHAPYTQDIPFNITATMPAFITLYHILFYDSSFIIMSSNRQPCGKVTCEYYFNLPSLYCDNNTRLSITVSAVNQLGEGPPSDSSIIGKSYNAGM